MSGSRYSQCFASASKAAGRKLKESELDDIFSKAQARIETYKRQGMSPRDAAIKAGRDLGGERRAENAAKKWQALRQFETQRELIKLNTAGREADYAKAITGGIETSYELAKGTNFDGAAFSADAVGHARAASVIGPMTAELKQAGLLDILATRGNKSFKENVIREMGGNATGNKFAAKAAEILNKYLELTRTMQNNAGATIGKLEEYMGRQVHDADRVRGDGSNAAYLKWRDAFLKTFGNDETFKDVLPADRENFTRGAWERIASGNHEGATGAYALSEYRGSSSLAKAVSRERKFFPNSSDAWLEYNSQFGHTDPITAIFNQIDHGARNAAIMDLLGPNPEATLEWFVNRLSKQARDHGDVNQAATVERLAGRYSSILDYAMKKSGGAEDPTFAKVTNIIRVLRSLQDFKLSGPISYFSDIGAIGAMTRHNDMNFLDTIFNQVRGLLPLGDDFLSAARELGVGIDGFNGATYAHLRAADGGATVRGTLAQMASTYEKWNGVKYWVNRQKIAWGMQLANRLATASEDFGKLSKSFQNNLTRYGIKADEWQAIRQMVSRNVEGEDYIFPNDAHMLPDSAVAHLVDNPNPTPRMLDNARQQLADKLSTYIMDQVRTGLSEPTAAISQMMLGRKAPPTVGSELRRSFLQFKTFPMTHVMRSLAREWFREPGGSIVSPSNPGGVAKFIASVSALGYISYALKRLYHAQQPVVPGVTDPLDSANSAKAIMAGIAQGGGLGVYGDFMFGETNRLDQGLAGTFAGPSYDTANDIAKLFQQDKGSALEGKLTWKKFGVQTSNILRHNLPMANLWYTKAALDYLILYSWQETVNPGYLARWQAQTQRDQGTKFLLSPSRDHVHTFGR